MKYQVLIRKKQQLNNGMTIYNHNSYITGCKIWIRWLTPLSTMFTLYRGGYKFWRKKIYLMTIFKYNSLQKGKIKFAKG